MTDKTVRDKKTLSAGDTLYSIYDPVSQAYLVLNGEIDFYITDEHKYSLNKFPSIIGGEEIILESADYKMRSEKAVAVSDVEYYDLTPPMVKQNIRNFKIGLQLARIGAISLKNINNFVTDLNSKLDNKGQVSKKFCVLYYETIKQLEEFWNQYRFSWLKEIVKKHSKEIIFARGRAFARKPAKLSPMVSEDESDVLQKTFSRGEIICEQGDEGDKMFILNAGNLEVLVSGKKVANIDQKGTIFGEMSFLINAPRTATIRVVDEAKLTVVENKNVEKFFQIYPNLFEKMFTILSKNKKHTIEVVKELQDLISESVAEDISGDKNVLAFQELRKEILDLSIQNSLDWLTKLLGDIRRKEKELLNA